MLIFRLNPNRSHKWFFVWDVKCGHQNLWHFAEANCIICFDFFGIAYLKWIRTNILLGFFNNTAWDRSFHAFCHLIWTFHVALANEMNTFIECMDHSWTEPDRKAIFTPFLRNICRSHAASFGMKRKRMAKESVFYVILRHWNGSIVNVCVLNIYVCHK